MPSTRLRLWGYRYMDSFLAHFNPVYGWIYSHRIKKRMQKGHSQPETVSIETTNRCQSHCPMCAHPRMTRPQGVMANEMFKNILAEIKDWREGLTLLLSGYGEPLLDPNIVEKVSLAKEAGFDNVGMFSNAELLEPNLAGELIRAGLTDLWASVDAIDTEIYQKCRPGLNFEKIVSNLITIAGMRTQKLPHIHIMGVILPESKDTWRHAPSFWRDIADDVIFRPMEGWAGTFEIPRRTWTPHRPRRIYPPCQHPWTQLNITWDGRGVLCCRDYDAGVVLGQFPARSPQMMWQLPPLECYREYHSQANNRKGMTLCENCHYYPVWW